MLAEACTLAADHPRLPLRSRVASLSEAAPRAACVEECISREGLCVPANRIGEQLNTLITRPAPVTSSFWLRREISERCKRGDKCVLQFRELVEKDMLLILCLVDPRAALGDHD